MVQNLESPGLSRRVDSHAKCDHTTTIKDSSLLSHSNIPLHVATRVNTSICSSYNRVGNPYKQ